MARRKPTIAFSPLDPRRVRANLRYLWALVKRFKVTFILLLLVQFGGSSVIWIGHGTDEAPISFAKAMGATFFLMMGQPSLDLPDSWGLMLVETCIPILGLMVLADGMVRFVYLFFAKHRKDKEWIAVQSHSFKGHVVLCGAGRVGFRVLAQLQRLGMDVVVVERNENAPFVRMIRDQGVPLLIDDVRAQDTLEATNIRHASAIICATDDDLANINIALDARRMNPDIRVVMRLFDDDLVKGIEGAFGMEAMSTSALAAPTLAAAAVDRSIRTSFDLDGILVAVGEFEVGSGLAGRTVAEVRDLYGANVLMLSRDGSPFNETACGEALKAGDRVVVQAEIGKYRILPR